MSLNKEVIKITEEEKDIRADKFLASKIDGVSRNFIQGLFDDGKVLINGKAEKGKRAKSVNAADAASTTGRVRFYIVSKEKGKSFTRKQTGQ